MSDAILEKRLSDILEELKKVKKEVIEINTTVYDIQKLLEEK